MAPKTLSKTAQTDVSNKKKAAGKETPKESLKKETKGGKLSDSKKTLDLDDEVLAERVQMSAESGQIDPDELEEQEEAASSASGGGNAAALAAATSGSSEISASFKNFRHHPDMENFYRFIFENDLRHEALAIIDEMMTEKLQRRTVKTSKTQPH